MLTFAKGKASISFVIEKETWDYNNTSCAKHLLVGQIFFYTLKKLLKLFGSYSNLFLSQKSFKYVHIGVVYKTFDDILKNVYKHENGMRVFQYFV